MATTHGWPTYSQSDAFEGGECAADTKHTIEDNPFTPASDTGDSANPEVTDNSGCVFCDLNVPNPTLSR
jgi:hypothetical protein